MKKLIYVLTLCMLTTLALRAQQKDSYKVSGHFTGLKDGTKVVMSRMLYEPAGAVQLNVDSTYAKDGQFEITGVVPEGPRVYLLKIFYNAQGFWFVRLFIDNGQHVTVRYDQDINKNKHPTMDDLVIYDGSELQSSYKLFECFGRVYDMTIGSINHSLRKIRDSLGYDTTAVNFLMETRRTFMTALSVEYFNHIPESIFPAATFFALYEQDDHSPFWADFYEQLNDHQKESYLGKRLKQKLSLLEGQKMPDFSLHDQSGKKVALGDIVKTGRVTLVHFWANKSAARGEYDTELREMYKKFHSKGLNIIGVSTESQEANWKAALATEKYPWYNVFDSKGKIVVDGVYHELGQVDHQNTTNVLIDKDGKIIAWDPTGVELQYYLIKAFGN